MALIRLNIDSFKRDLGGIANRLANQVVNKIENKLENAVEDVFAKGLKKIGLSDGVSREIASRFTDSISVGRADEFFGSSTAEQNRVSKFEIEERLIGNDDGRAETARDAVQRIRTADITSAPVMQFPDQLGQYYMKLDFQSYHRPSPQMQAVFKRFKTIILPIPRDLKETFELNVEGKPQGAAGGLADLGTDLLRGAGDKAGGEFAILYSFAAQALEGTTGDILGQALGAVPNPHLQAIFSGVDLRRHTFQWTFAPRNAQESRNLKAIIKELKKNSLPAYSSMGTAALQYPPMVEIMLMPWGTNLIKFKKCLVDSVSINYAPAGLPSFFQGTQEPTMIQIEIQFLETEIQTAKDYGLQPGEREDGLENLKDILEKGADELGLGEYIDQGKEAIDKTKNTISRVAAESNAKREN
jgi:hypothetical protein